VSPILRKHDALFKVPSRLDLLISLNSGLPDFSQVGKFLTVYPRSTAEAIDLVLKLHAATRGLPGPEIPFDARYRKHSLVYYRYGSFLRSGKSDTRGTIVDRHGRLHPDKRASRCAIPHWLHDPFGKRRAKSTNSHIGGPLAPHFLPFRAIIQRGKGGVYEAVDLSVSPARLVIIKEGRRHGETALDGADGYAHARQEASVLRALCHAGVPVPKLFREFSRHGKRYLVLEKIAGRPLLPRNHVQPAKFSWRLAAKLLSRLAPVLKAIHSAGYVWRDCKPEHIFMSHDKVCLIDFEGACRISETGVVPWGSHPYVPPIYLEEVSGRRPGTLEDDYALGVILFQFLSGKFPSVTARARSIVYKRTRCPDRLGLEIERRLTG
jgi:tRNA A-37 threonylcarbamoyl transferase component Bud32